MQKACKFPLLTFAALVIFCGMWQQGQAGDRMPGGKRSETKRTAAKVSPQAAIDAQAAHYRSPQDKVTFFYTEGLRAGIATGDTAMARSFFDRALAIDPEHSPSLYELANISIGNPKEAIKYSLRANELDSTNIWYKMQLGRLLIVNERYDSALTVYKNLIKLSPTNPDNYRMLAALHEQTGKPFTAIAVLDSAESVFGKIEELAEYKRQLLISVKMYDRAIEEAKALTIASPYNDEQYVILGELYAAVNQDSLAMDAFDKALTVNPNSIGAIIAMNEYFRRRGNNTGFLATAKKIFASDEVTLDKKIEFFNTEIKKADLYTKNYFQVNDIAATLALKYPGDYRAQDLYARHLIYSGDTEEALKLYKSYLTDTTTNIDLINNILNIEAYLNRSDSVDKYSAIAVKLFPKNTDMYIRRGGVLGYMKRYKDAEKEYKSAMKYAADDSTRSVVYGMLGDLYYISGNKKYIDIYEKALKLNGNNAAILNNYSYYLSEQGKELDRALEMAVKANELSPNNPTYLDTHAWVLYKRGEYEQAKKIMRIALSLDRDANPELMLHYGDILFKLGDDFMATVYWKKAQEKGYDKDEIEKRLKQTEKK